MCGIAGFFSTPSRFDPQTRLSQQLSALTRRGPDGLGTYVAQGGKVRVHREVFAIGTVGGRPWKGPLLSPDPDFEVALGINRLSIVDVEGGQAPSISEDGSVVVVLNGEIYNYKALAEELRKKGHSLASQSDTEIICHLYEEVGFEGVLARIQGMFGLALFDARRGVLFLARDVLGIKPLYVAEQALPGGGHCLYFASELKGILACPEVERRLSAPGLMGYLRQESVPAPHSILERCQKLEAGTYLEVFKGAHGDLVRRKRVFWSLPDPHADRLQGLPALTDIQGWKNRVWGLLEGAVEKRIPQERPVAALLSGGIDSGLITTLLAAKIKGRLTAFTLGFEDSDFDESTRAGIITKALGAEHRIIGLKQSELPGLLEEIGAQMCEPLGDHSLIPTWQLMKGVQQAGFPVALAGDGGDELFAGYPTYLVRKLDAIWDRLPASIVKPLLKVLGKVPSSQGNFAWDMKLRLILEGALCADGPSRQARWMGAFSPPQIQSLLTPEAREWVQEREAGNALEDVKKWAHSHRRRGGLQRALVQDLRFYLQDGVLVKEDRASMAFGIEARVPMLDTDLVSLSMRMPSHLKIRGMQTKWILRELAKEHLPKSIVNAPKKGFAMPTARWLKALPEGALNLLLEGPKGSVPLFRQDVIRGYVQGHREGKADHRRLLWTLIMFRQWQKSQWGVG